LSWLSLFDSKSAVFRKNSQILTKLSDEVYIDNFLRKRDFHLFFIFQFGI